MAPVKMKYGSLCRLLTINLGHQVFRLNPFSHGTLTHIHAFHHVRTYMQMPITDFMEVCKLAWFMICGHSLNMRDLDQKNVQWDYIGRGGGSQMNISDDVLMM
jgi:hypothetical protein